MRELTTRLAEVAERVRGRMDRLGEIDAASQDVLIEVVRALEQQLWMVRVQLGHAAADVVRLARLPGSPARRSSTLRASRPASTSRPTSRCSPPARRRTRRSRTGASPIDGEVDAPRVVDVGRVHRAAGGDGHGRHPLRDEVDEARHDAGGACRSTRCSSGVEPRAAFVTAFSDGGYTTNLPLEDVTRRPGLGRLRVRRRAAAPRARRAGAAAGAAPVLLEEREVGPRADAHARRRAGLLGGLRLPRPRRPVAGAALPGRLSWQLATAVELVEETARTRSIAFEVPGWPGGTARASTSTCG